MTDWRAAEIRQVPVASLVPYARNARTHSPEQVAQIAGSIREFGFTNPVLIDETGGIIARHGRVMAAQKLGIDAVPCIVLAHLTKTQRQAYVLADNKIALNAGWDDELLRLEIADLKLDGFDINLTGFNELELGALLAETTEGETDPDDVPEPQPDPVTQPGDLWLLGPHRLLCGDTTDAATVARVMGGERAALLVTSPPYGNQRDYTTGGVADWDALMHGTCSHLSTAMADDGQALVNLGPIHRDGEWQPYWQGWLDWMRAQGWRRFGWYVWDQGQGLPGDWNGRLAPSFEFIFHFNRTARQANKIVPCRWAGHVNAEKGGLRAKDGTVGTWTHAGQGVQDTRIPDNVLRITRHKARGIETEHPAVFPVALPAFLMEAYSDADAVIYEPFSGSGTTILAGQRTGRHVRAIELAPQYVDVAVRRWQQFTGQSATLESTGRSFAEHETERAPRT